MNRLLATKFNQISLWQISLWRTLLPVGFVLLLLTSGGVGEAMAEESLPKVWSDEITGFAIDGFDPVNYFVEGKALHPTGLHEAFWGGAGWRFRNSGNKAAFLAHPEIYAPRLGGLDPFWLIKGRAVRGKPTLFDIYRQRLYLFYDQTSLGKWQKNRAAILLLARQNWPRAAHELGLDTRPDEEP